MGLKDYFSGMFKRPSYSNGELYDEDEEDDDFDEDEEDDDFDENEEDDNFENDEDEFQNDDYQDEGENDDGYGEDQNFDEDNSRNQTKSKKDGIKQKIGEIKSEMNQVKDNINFFKERKQNAIRNDCISIMPVKFECPICGRKSLYCEKVGKMTSRGVSYFLKTSIGIADSYDKILRFRCVNKKCKSYFNRTGDTFFYSNAKKKLQLVKNYFFIPKE